MISLLGLVSGTGMAPLESKAEKGGVSSAGSNIRLSELSPSRKNENLSLEVKKHFLEIVSTYTKYQEMMDRKSDLVQIAETLGGIIDAARELALHESDDWFDKHTIKRNMSELDKLSKEFDKFAVEANGLDQRLHGLYEDMGHILSRYYKFGDISEKQMKSRLGLGESKKGCGCNSINEGEYKIGRKIDLGKGMWIDLKTPRGSVGVLFRDKNNLKKYDLTNPSDLEQIHQLFKKSPFGAPVDESVNEDTKKRFDVDFYKGDNDRQTSHEEIIRGDKFSDVVSQAIKVAKSKGMNYVEFYYKDSFIGSIDKRNNYTFKNGRDYKKSPLSVTEDGKLQGGADDPCWKGYEMVGMKTVKGKEVPNCVPKK